MYICMYMYMYIYITRWAMVNGGSPARTFWKAFEGQVAMKSVQVGCFMLIRGWMKTTGAAISIYPAGRGTFMDTRESILIGD